MLMASPPFDTGAVLGSMPSGGEVDDLELPVFAAGTWLTAEKTKARPTTKLEAKDGAPPKKKRILPIHPGQRAATSPLQVSGEDSRKVTS